MEPECGTDMAPMRRGAELQAKGPKIHPHVVPAKAGSHTPCPFKQSGCNVPSNHKRQGLWVPAFAGTWRMRIDRQSGDQPRQLPHIIECRGSTRVPERVRMTGPTMAAAVEAQHGHPGGARGSDAGQAVFDHDAS